MRFASSAISARRRTSTDAKSRRSRPPTTAAPKASQVYSVETDDITKIENAVLDPVFGDILQGTSADAGATKVGEAAVLVVCGTSVGREVPGSPPGWTCVLA